MSIRIDILAMIGREPRGFLLFILRRAVHDGSAGIVAILLQVQMRAISIGVAFRR
jgi:hypothetical protein